MDAGCQKKQKVQRINNLMCFLANIQPPKLNKLWKTVTKQSFSLFYEVSWSLFNLGWILAQKHIKVLILVLFRFFWHPWHTPGGASIYIWINIVSNPAVWSGLFSRKKKIQQNFISKGAISGSWLKEEKKWNVVGSHRKFVFWKPLLKLFLL